jgi:P-type Ca2+ transporter type 2B
LRDSKEQKIHRNFLMVGDIIMIQNGMNVPVDGIVISGVGVMADESAMTGESDHLPKEALEKCIFRQQEHEADGKFTSNPHDVPSPVLLSGTQIQTGQGWFLCSVVGDDTCENQILAAVEAKEAEATPLQNKLDTIATDIGKLGMYCAILIVHALMVRQFLESMMRRNFDLWGGESTKGGSSDCANNSAEFANVPCDGFALGYVKQWLGYIITGVAIIVVAVPEGLPLAVMISLAYSVSRMLADNNFVKKLASCEIMGGANNICSDKTGTLTKNQMTWTQIWCGVDKKVEDPDGSGPITDLIGSENTMTLLAQAVSCNTLGTHDDAGATELAMLKFINRCDVDYQFLRQKYLPKAKDLLRFPFDSSRKRMSTVLEMEDSEATEHNYNKRLHVKGASEIVLATCTHYLDAEGTKQILDD